MRCWLLLALLVAPLALAQPGGRDVNIVVWHASPDPQAGQPGADPFSGPTSPATTLLPATVVDGTLRAEGAPEGDPANVGAHYRELQRLLQLSERSARPVTLRLAGNESGGALTVVAAVTGAATGQARAIAGALVEDGLEHEGASGVRVHRYVARATLEASAGTNATWSVPLDATWARERLSVVVWVLGENATVLQSARWSPGQGDVVQQRKAVLVERVTATWCVPCGPSDEALALLAAQFGDAGEAPRAGGYFRAPGMAALAGLLLGGAAAVFLWRRPA